MTKAEVYYPAGMEELKKTIEDMESELHKAQDKLKEQLRDTMVLCKQCNSAHKISELEGTAHMYYVDNVYSGYYALSEYSFICPACGVNIREYDQPELKKLRPYYGKKLEVRKD